MSGLVLPEALRDVEPVRSIRTPARLEYRFTAGEATSRFLRGIARRKILGEQCGRCHKVILPPPRSCPTCGVPTSEQVKLPTTASSTFCVVNVKFSGSAMELPYVCATVLPDGADMGLFGMVPEVPFDQIHGYAGRGCVGRRRRAHARPGLDQVVASHRRARRRLRQLPGARVDA